MHPGVSMTATTGDYVLGTDRAELARLGVQHRAWREVMLGAWRRAGLREGWRVADVGAGPGYATWDLAGMVGAAGRVIAVERSAAFVEELQRQAAVRDLPQVSVIEGDLMELAPLAGCDMAWCRWVASFVPSVPTLVHWLRQSIRPGGRVVLHEYADYGSWRFAPPRPVLQEFVQEVMASWRDSGGEPDVASSLIGELRQSGFKLVATRPHLFTTAPGDLTWQWPAGFVAVNAHRLLQLGRVSEEWVARVITDMAGAERDAESLMITPLVLEIIAERR
jgi:precorrin-6B methylase 2